MTADLPDMPKKARQPIIFRIRSRRDSARVRPGDPHENSDAPSFRAGPASPVRCRSCRAIHVRCPCGNRCRSCSPVTRNLRVDFRRAPRLLGEVHRRRGMAVAAFQRIIGLHPRPFVLGEFEPVIQELLPGVDRAEDLAPDFLRGLHLAGDLVGPVVRNVAVGAGRADARAVREMRACAATPGTRCRAFRGRRCRTSRCW